MMRDADPVQSFDLPDDCDLDHVAIYPNDAPNEPQFEAVPFYERDTFDDGTTWYDEALEFTITEQYRQAVAERADVPIEDILLERQLETYGFTEL